MNIVADESLPFLDELFMPLGQVLRMPGRSITKNSLKKADVLLVRSVTPITYELLCDTGIRFLGSMTSGKDHIDMAALQQLDIGVACAEGCNSWAVVDYVISALCWLNRQNRCVEKGKTVGIIGCGQIGSRLCKLIPRLDLSVIIHDPFVDKIPGLPFVSLEELLSLSDIISLHVPLTKYGIYPTHHLIGHSELLSMKSDSILINTSRGAVVDNRALLNHLDRAGSTFRVVLDVWEHEPNILSELLQRVSIGTPHIAGYTYEGKVRGITQLCQLVMEYFSEEIGGDSFKVLQRQLSYLRVKDLNVLEQNSHEDFVSQVRGYYPIEKDDNAMRQLLKVPSWERSTVFDMLRRTYVDRNEFSSYLIK